MKRCISCFKDIPEELEICPYCGYIEGSSVKATNYLEMGAILASRYIIGNVIGNDKFGVTYIAWDGKLEQRVAIKEYLPNEFSTREPGQTKITVFGGEENAYFRDGMNAFLDEAKRLAKFQNEDGIVKVFNYISENDTAYIVMEYLEGQTLRDLLETKKVIPEREATQMLMPVMESLKTVHADGMIHGNITPDSIFVTSDGKAKLIDFGASRFASTHSRNLTEMLNPGYSPEEQYKNREDMGTYSDVYSLAATLYKMVTGETPPDALERKTNIESTKRDIIKEPSLLGKRISLRWENAVMNALNVRIEDRTQNMGQLIWELNSVLPALRRYGNTKKININRWPLWIKIVSGASILLIAAVVVLLATGVFGKTMDFITGSLFGVGYTNVPNIVNMHVDEASTVCANSSVILQVYDKSYSSDIKSGLIKSQSVEEGCVVEKNSVVFAAVSAGQAMILVQDYQGYNGDAVAEGLDESGLKYSLVTEQSGIMPGCVATQSVDYGTICDAETFEIELTISEGQNYEEGYSEVPDFSNVPFESAADIATDNSMYVVKTTTEASDTVPEGYVISQIPEAGTVIKNGGTVELVVSGKEIQLVPDVQYKNADEAISYLQSLGFVVETKYEDNDVVYKNHVVSQSITANSIVETGAEITLVISNGNPHVAEPDEELSKQLESGTVISNATDSKMSVIQAASIGEYLEYVPQTYADANGLVFAEPGDFELITSTAYIASYGIPYEDVPLLGNISISEVDNGDGTKTITATFTINTLIVVDNDDDFIWCKNSTTAFFDQYTGLCLYKGDTTIEWEGNPYDLSITDDVITSGYGYTPTTEIYTVTCPIDYYGAAFLICGDPPREYDEDDSISTSLFNPPAILGDVDFNGYPYLLFRDSNLQTIQVIEQESGSDNLPIDIYSTADNSTQNSNEEVPNTTNDLSPTVTEATITVKTTTSPTPTPTPTKIPETTPLEQESESGLTDEIVNCAMSNWLQSVGMYGNSEIGYSFVGTQMENGMYVTDVSCVIDYTDYTYYTDPSSGYTYETKYNEGSYSNTGVSFNIYDYIS